MTFYVGARCWYPSKEHGWVGAEIIELNSESTEARLRLENDEEIEVNLDKIKEDFNDALHLRNPPVLEATDDLTSLTFLNEPAVLHAIKKRFTDKNIYTYSGIVLIATNPFANVDELYSPEKIHEYSTNRKEDLQPHIFAIADSAFKHMKNYGENQTIIVSGESGAGKTVSAKYIMRYYASVQDEAAHMQKTSEIEHRILATNPIMEAFGNAKTTRNDNSSRFGKYLSISFNKDNKILGAQIKTYLLERSRLVFQPKGERNYHIFYQMLNGLTDDQKVKLHLDKPIDYYYYMNQGGDPYIPDVSDKDEFHTTINALGMVGIHSEVQEQIFQILSGILHLGNIEIKKLRNDASVSSEDKNLQIACELLGIDSFNFAKWITKKQIITRSEKIISNLNYNQAIVVRDSVSKFIYSALFNWLIETINANLNKEIKSDDVKYFIGVLDIYGFEHFEKNSFEQFCINYANEKLQQEFNQHVFKLEQEEYIKEEIEWSFIEFNDNQPCIDLIENKLGILSLLDEESRLPSGSDESWTQKLYQSFDKEPTNKVFSKPRFGQTKFVVSHYAHDVAYDVEGFIEKNRDTVPDTHLEILKSSSNKMLVSLLDNLEKTSMNIEEKKKEHTTFPGSRRMVQKKPTLGSLFKGSLTDLMNTINATNVHYIRCIKPNPNKEAWKFENLMVLSQLRACGVLETIKMSSAGFPSRWSFDEFVQRYYFLVPNSEWQQYLYDDTANLLPLVKNILDVTIDDKEKYQIGRTKIFFRAGMLAQLEKLRSTVFTKIITKIQKKIRGRYYRKQYLAIIESIRNIQLRLHNNLLRKKINHELQIRFATMIQSVIRAKTVQTYYADIVRSNILLQAYLKKILIQEYIRQEQRKVALVLIQSRIKAYYQRSKYTKMKKSSIMIQSHMRKRAAQIEYQKLKESMMFSNSEEAKLIVEFLDFIKELKDKINENKTNYDTIKQLENSEDILSILNNDTKYNDMKLEINNVINLLQKNYSDIKTLRKQYIQWQNTVKSQLKYFNNKETHKADNKTNILHERLHLLDSELKDIVLLNDTSKFATINHSASPESKLNVDLENISEDSTMFLSQQVNNPNIKNILTVEKDIFNEVHDEFLKSYTIPRIVNEFDNNISILYPALLINFVSQKYIDNKLFNNLINFLESSINSILQNMSNLSDDKNLVGDGLFWFSNLFEIYSYIKSFIDRDETHSYWHELIGNALITAYNTWLKKLMSYIRYDLNLSNILIGSPSRFNEEGINEKKLTHLLVFFYELIKFSKMYKLENHIVHGIIINILNFTNSLCVNDLCVKFYNMDWKLGHKIHNNLKSLDDWFLKHNIKIDPRKDLVHLRQLCTLLQLRMNNLSDLEVAKDFCYLLNPVQLQTILKKYKPAKGDSKIPSDILDHLANVINKDKSKAGSLTLKMELNDFPNPVLDKSLNLKTEIRVINEADLRDPNVVNHPKYKLASINQIVRVMTS
ncbi:myosin 4 PWA37_002223 [Arxiozyma heterogenica]|uniref:myosin 4 n=1 Tax=Arxiozyma heterogenica TaxID=278026 RepID=UPI002EEA1B32